MLRSALRHRKISRLADLLGVPRYAAVGLVECLWHLTAVQAPRGDIGKLTDAEIAEGVFWPKRNSKRLIECLSSPHVLLIDTCKCHRLRVHDWDQHADQSVKKTVAKGLSGFIPCYLEKTNSGTIPDTKRNCSVLPEPVNKPEPEPGPVNAHNPLAEGRMLEEIECPICFRAGNLKLTQARGIHPAGFWCERRGGCGANWPLSTEAILSQMTSRGRKAIEAMMPAEERPYESPGMILTSELKFDEKGMLIE